MLCRGAGAKWSIPFYTLANKTLFFYSLASIISYDCLHLHLRSLSLSVTSLSAARAGLEVGTLIQQSSSFISTLPTLYG